MNALYRDTLNTVNTILSFLEFELTYMYMVYTVFQSNDLHVIS